MPARTSIQELTLPIVLSNDGDTATVRISKGRTFTIEGGTMFVREEAGIFKRPDDVTKEEFLHDFAIGEVPRANLQGMPKEPTKGWRNGQVCVHLQDDSYRGGVHVLTVHDEAGCSETTMCDTCYAGLVEMVGPIDHTNES